MNNKGRMSGGIIVFIVFAVIVILVMIGLIVATAYFL